MQQTHSSNTVDILPPPSLAPLAELPKALPATPQDILASGSADQRRKRPWLLYTGGGLLAAQLILPQPMKPSAIVGGIAADFYRPIMQTSAANTVNLAQQQALAQRIAELEGQKAEWMGNCALGGLFSPDLGQTCEVLVNQRYQNAVLSAKRSLGIR